ncbi:HAD family hydrolase [Cyanobacterium stanieri LEGE 03274]|uniref:HAD family hydrolase n=1 Tax=Cyanobacterium stanieri LEGE 03274 TaxID=1828756 RepID=A0ABR9V0L0_9CHRO|nr:HAD family hydrolase [Cyanobacterium stanieri]MBE9221412.1 HAD family hydrolase [Cyanobacterium stanieri LEGE 03274]
MNRIIALDFDGVICDGMAEYFHSSRLTYEIIWEKKLEDLAYSQEVFQYLRPTIETGWEMPLIFRAMDMEKNKIKLFNQWSYFVDEILKKDCLMKELIAQQLDKVRENDINNNLDKWLNLHRFYPHIIDRIKDFINETYKIYIITTKEGKFAKQILINGGINVDKIIFWGKEQKRKKYESLQLIVNQENVKPTDICFIEDRLEALERVNQQEDLVGVKLFLASWGYNTEETRASVTSKSSIKLLSLTDFTKGDMVNLFS